MYEKCVEELLIENEKEYIAHKPESVVWELTKSCNKKCPFCYESLDIKNAYFLDDEDINLSIKFFNDNFIEYIALSGGEPLLFPDLEKVLKKLGNKKITIITNGLLLDDSNIQLLKRYHCNIRISWDIYDNKMWNILEKLEGNDYLNYVTIAITYYQQSVSEVIDAIRKLRNYYAFPIEINYAVFKGSAIYYDGVLKNMIELSTKVIQLNLREKFNIEGQYISVPVENYLGGYGLKCFNCSIGTNLKLDTYGNVYPCPFFNDRTQAICNIKETLFIGEAETLIVAKKRAFSRYNKKSCSKCNWNYFCGGGCLAYCSDDEDVNPFICELNDSIYKYVNSLFNLYQF